MLRLLTVIFAFSLIVTGAGSASAQLFSRSHVSDKLTGRLEKTTFPTPALGGSRTVYVYTPPGYTAVAPKTYPVLVLLHGSPGGQLDWINRGESPRRLDEAIQSGRFPASILLIPDGHGPFYKGGSEWADSVDGRCKMETALTVDLPRWVKSHYAASPDPALWTLGGLSEGGYGAANLVVRHPDVYRNALVLSGEFAVSDDWGDTEAVFGKDAANRERNSPSTMIRRLSPAVRHGLHFYLAVGADDDTDLIAENASFAGLCKALGVPVRLDRDPGSHKWSFWGDHFSLALAPLAEWLKAGKG